MSEIVCHMLFDMRFQVEDEDTVTGARVVDGDEDEDEQGVETILGRSKLRAAAEGTYLANTFEHLGYLMNQVCSREMQGTGARRGAGGPWTKILMGHWIRI